MRVAARFNAGAELHACGDAVTPRHADRLILQRSSREAGLLRRGRARPHRRHYQECGRASHAGLAISSACSRDRSIPCTLFACSCAFCTTSSSFLPRNTNPHGQLITLSIAPSSGVAGNILAALCRAFAERLLPVTTRIYVTGRIAVEHDGCVRVDERDL